MKTYTPGPWRVAQVIAPGPREKFDPSKPYEVSRRVGRYSEKMKDAYGNVVRFASEEQAIAMLNNQGE